MGGSCDVIGDLWRSSLGEIAGGLPGVGCYDNDGSMSFFQANAGPLSGGGGSVIGGQYCFPVGGAALIGGGGGRCYYGQGTWGPLGGRGGQGLVIFQYIP